MYRKRLFAFCIASLLLSALVIFFNLTNPATRELEVPEENGNDQNVALHFPLESNIVPNSFSEKEDQFLNSREGPFEIVWIDEIDSAVNKPQTIIALLRDSRNGTWLRLEETIGSEESSQRAPSRLMLADRLLVKLSDEQFISLSNLGLSMKRLASAFDYYHVFIDDFEEKGKFDRAIATLSEAIPNTLIEPDLIYWTTNTFPNDPDYHSEQWAFQETGNGIIDIPLAWDIKKRASGEKIAIMDTGIDIDHEDINPNLWRNPGEVEDNGLDDDQNGFIDDVSGYSFIRSSSDIDDINGHGTHVAGIAAAVGNNGIGISGIAWEADLVGIQVLNDEGYGPTSTLVQGIAYANSIGANILNMSLSSSSKSEILEEAIGSAEANDSIIVASAGNEYSNIDSPGVYPASFPNDAIISVSASTRGGKKADFSNSGTTAVDLAAPGSYIYSTFPVEKGSYKTMSGTSMSAPMVSGTLALLQAHSPHLNAFQRKSRIIEGLNRFQHFEGQNSGSGILNTNNALRGLKTGPYYDSFEKPIRLNPNQEVWMVNNFNSSKQYLEPNHNSSDSSSTIWALLVYNRQVAVEITAESDSMQTDIEIYSGSSIGGLNSIAMGDSNNPARFTTKGGTIYRIAISGRDNAQGAITIRLNQRPENDDFAGATKIDGDEILVSTSNVGATAEPNEPPHAGWLARNTLWWKYTPSESALVRVDTEGSNFDTNLAIYTGSSIGDLTLVGSNDNAFSDSLTSSVEFQAVANTDYYVVAGSSDGKSGLLQLRAGLLKPLQILEQPQDVSPQIGGTAIFRVVANQTVFTTYQWYFNGFPLSNQTSDRLILSDVDKNSIGDYKVFVSNGISSETTHEVSLSLGYTKRGVALNPSSASVPIGSNAFLYAGIDTNSPIEYQWYKNGVSLNNGINAVLPFDNASQNDNGLYHLVATGDFGTIRTNQALVLVEDQNAHEERSFWPVLGEGDEPRVKELERQFFLLGQLNAVYQSSNGRVWLKLVPGLQGRVTEIAYNGSQYYVFSDQFEGAWTTDFVNWTTFDLPTHFKLLEVYYGNSVFVAEAHEAENGTERLIAVSENAEDWSTFKGANVPREIVFGNGAFVGGNGFQAFLSSNGSSWEILEGFFNSEDVLFSGSEFLLSESFEQPVVSTDGRNWESNFPGSFYREIYASGGVWMTHKRNFPSFEYSDDSREFVDSGAYPGTDTDQDFTIAHSNGDVVLVSEQGLILSKRLSDPMPTESVSKSNPGYASSLNKPIVDLGLSPGLKFANPLSEFDLKERVIDPFGELERIEVWVNGKKKAEAFPPNFHLNWRPASFGKLKVEIRAVSEGADYPVDGDEIISLVPMPKSLNPKFEDIAGITVFKGQFYRISSQSSMQRSINGLDWEGVPLPQYGSFFRILANSKSIIALNTDLQVLQSNDGANWNLVRLDDDLVTSSLDIALIENNFYIYLNARRGLSGGQLDGSGAIFQSNDGTDWKSSIPFPEMMIRDLAISNGRLLGKFVSNTDEFGPAVLGLGSLQANSVWSLGDSIDGSGIIDIESFNGVFAAATGSNKVFHSTNGETWTQAVIEPQGEILRLTNVGDRLSVASATNEGTFESTTHLYETSNYKDWNSSSFEENGTFHMIDSASSERVAASIWTEYLWSFPVRGHLRLSVNGGPWRDAGLSGEFTRIEKNGNQFVAVGPSGGVATSADGFNWSESAGSYWDRSTVEGHAWFNGELFVSIDNSLHRYSKSEGLVDLEIVSRGSIAATDTLIAIENDPISETGTSLHISSDGRNFTELVIESPAYFEKLFATSTHLIAYSSSQEAFYSSNGTDWTALNPGFDIPSADAIRILNNGYILIEKDRSSFALSNNPSTWDIIQHSFDLPINQVVYSKGEYWLFTGDNTVQTTTDFSHWESFTYNRNFPFPDIIDLPNPQGEIADSASGSFVNDRFVFHHNQPDTASAFSVLNMRTELSSQYNILTIKSAEGFIGIIPLGDLAIAKILVASEDVGMVGDPISGSIEVVNLGLETVHISADTIVELFIQNGSEEDSSIPLIRFPLEQSDLNSGETISIPFESKTPEGIAPGPLYIGSLVDANDDTFEMNEFNNRYLNPSPIGTVDTVSVTIQITGDGYVNSSLSLDRIAANNLVELFPVPQNGAQFVEWNGDYQGTLTPASFSAASDMTITAKFARLVNLTIETVGGGIVTKTPESQLIETGQFVELVALPDPGWQFEKWEGDLASSNAQESFPINQDMSIYGTFSFNYDAWLSNYFSEDGLNNPNVASPDSDPDKDGIPNLMEAVLKSSPNVSEKRNPFDIRFENERFTVSFNEIRGWEETDWNVQSRNSTSDWKDHPFNLSSIIIDPRIRSSKIEFEAELNESTIYRLTISRNE